ncbi:cellulase family glycosylhydrolase [Fulvivirga sediminis]|uniref:Cellulase family glycosylhydrolase n=1 Tax=Fulvivirga sediminis TaxID=2803949 RepID=A0A937FAV2_9BACT|nr:cellulase family glycosylhydrolase [Fulvivirga sediminis]MBL3657454.1 cellulase family glycosylhydrolase [Fulvivirga sediminis]
MTKTNKYLSSLFLAKFLFIFFLSTTLINSSFGQPPLTVSGNRILSGGVETSFAGNSFFWSNNEWGAERFYNANCVEWLKNDWESTIVRAAMGIEEDGGYIDDPSGNKNRVKAVVDAAIDQGIYAIIDWHSHHAENYQSEAINFFKEMATEYGSTNNVIYEVYNEPLGNASWSGQVKPYAEAVIAAIRSIDPDNLIVVGSPNWSQDVDVASRNPITGYNNIAYSLHFYAGTHGQYLRDKATTAMNNGAAIMVTEWGTVNANGDGGVNESESNAWMNFLEDNNISHCNWSVHDKQEGASILRPGASSNGGWSSNDLTASGKFVRNIIKNWESNLGGGGNSAPTAIITVSVDESTLTADFTGSGSSDPDGDMLTYTWSFGDGNTATGVNTSHTYSNPGTYTVSLTVNDGNGNSGSKTMSIYLGSSDGGGGNGCNFNTPRASALPSKQNSYTHVHVSSGGPNLSNISDLTINWDLPNNGLYQFSARTTNGSPSWWNDLIPKASHNFNQSQPSISLSGTGFPGLDGEYWVTFDGDNFVMVSKTDDYYIYFSNSASAPSCLSIASTSNYASFGGKADEIIYPNPSNSEFSVRISTPEKAESINLYDSNGLLIRSYAKKSIQSSMEIGGELPRGLYILKVNYSETSKSYKLIKK